MDTNEIFDRLLKMRRQIEKDIEEPLLSSDNALLADVAKALDLTDEQADILSDNDGNNSISAQPPLKNEDTYPYDFDGGFGIGGLARHEEKPFVPTVPQIKRLEQMEARATTCRRCGQSNVFDGAMFTTIRGGDVCDDCVG